MWFTQPGALVYPVPPTTQEEVSKSGIIKQITEKEFTD